MDGVDDSMRPVARNDTFGSVDARRPCLNNGGKMASSFGNIAWTLRVRALE